MSETLTVLPSSPGSSLTTGGYSLFISSPVHTSSTASDGSLVLVDAGAMPAATDSASDFLRRYAQIQRVLFKLLSFHFLGSGWDGFGSVAPSGDDIVDASDFLLRLPIYVRLPRVYVEGDGEVGFFWTSEEGYAEVGLKGRKISYYARSVDGKEIEGSHLYAGSREILEGLFPVLGRV